MIHFMLIGFPRSGTTWAANWLTTEKSVCVHDPLYKVHYSQWDNADSDYFPHPAARKRIGVSCTGIWRWPEFVNRYPARKIVVTRDLSEVNCSMRKLGFPELPNNAQEKLDEIDAPRVPYTDLFDPKKAPFIWEQLMGDLPFNAMRHAQLREYNVQPKFDLIKPDAKVTRRLFIELLGRKTGY